MQPISASVDIPQQVLRELTLQSKQELKVNKMWEFKEVLNQYSRGPTSIIFSSICFTSFASH